MYISYICIYVCIYSTHILTCFIRALGEAQKYLGEVTTSIHRGW